MTKDQIIKRLQADIDRLGTQKAVAAELGVTLPYLNDVFRGRRDIGPTILAKLGLEKVVTYREIERT